MLLQSRITECPNLFDKRTAIRRKEPWEPGQTLADLHPIQWNDLSGTSALLNGVKHDVMTWDEVEVPPDSEVIYYTVPEGISIAVAIGLTGIAAIAVGVAINVAIAVGLSLLISKFIGPPEQPEFGSSPTYDWGNLQMTSRNGQPIPVIYGPHRVAGQVLSARPTKNDEGDTILRLLVGFGEGPVQSIGGLTQDANALTGDNIPDGIRINQNQANELEGIKAWVRLGDLQQSIIPGFDEVVNVTNVGQELLQGFPITVTTATPVESFENLLFFPNGLYYRKKRSGKGKTECVTYTIRWRLNGETEWAEETTTTLCKHKESPFSILVRNDNPGIIYGEAVTIDVQIEKDTDVADYRHFDQMTWVSISEIIPGRSTAYPHIACCAFEIPAQAEANNTVPTITVDMEGKVVWTWDTADLDPETSTLTLEYSTNPAHVMMDWLLSKRYGGGDVFQLCDIDLTSFDDWRSYCDTLVDDLSGKSNTEKRWECGLVLDTERGFWDIANNIAMTGRASLILAGRTVKIKVEKAASAVQLFSDANIVIGSLSIQYVSNEDRPNILEAQFLDVDANYEHGFASLEDSVRLTTDAVPKNSTVQLYGMTKKFRAYRQLQYLLNVNRLLTRTIQFETGTEALLVEPGDVFAFQHNIPKWDGSDAFGGRFLADGTLSTVTLDQDLTIADGETYRIYFRTDGGGEDVVRNRNIAESAGTYTAGTALTLDNTVTSNTPVRGDVYAIVETTQASEITNFRCLEVEMTQDLTVRISGMEYNADVYDDTPNIKVPEGGDDPIDPGTIPPNPTNMSLVVQGSENLELVVSWDAADWPFTFAHRVGLRDDTLGNPGFTNQGRTEPGLNQFIIDDPEIGSTYTISVAPCSADGTSCRKFSKGKIGSITITEAVDVPDPVTNITCSQNGPTVTISWTGIDEDDNDLDHYEVRRGISWVSGTIIGTTTNTSIDTTNWAIGDETFLVRAVSSTGVKSETSELCTATLVNNSPETTDTSRDEVSLGWTGTTSNTTVNADGELEISSSQTSGTYEVTGITPSGGLDDYRVHMNFHARQDDLEETWDSSAKTWADATETWEDAIGTWSDDTVVWESVAAKKRSWEGIIADDDDTTLLIEVKPNGSGSYQTWSPGIYNFSTLDFRLTLTRSSSTGRQIRLDQGVVTLSNNVVAALGGGRIGGSITINSASTTTHNQASTDYETIILCNCTTANITVHLDTASSMQNRVIYIKKTDSSANTVTIDGDSSETIDGDTTVTLSTEDEVVGIWSDGTEWHIIGAAF